MEVLRFLTNIDWLFQQFNPKLNSFMRLCSAVRDESVCAFSAILLRSFAASSTPKYWVLDDVDFFPLGDLGGISLSILDHR
jgi:hypothetical protein